MESSRPRHDPGSRAAGAADLERAGGQDAPVEVVDYDAAWPARFAAERDRLAAFLPGARIEHVGSTAVPGLAAKPVIDLLALVEDLDTPIATLVESAGYQFPEAFNASLNGRRWLCRPSAAHRTHHLHLVDDPVRLERYLHFRDRLRSEPSLAGQYADLKRELAARFRDDREGYADAKRRFIDRAVGTVGERC